MALKALVSLGLQLDKQMPIPLLETCRIELCAVGAVIDGRPVAVLKEALTPAEEAQMATYIKGMAQAVSEWSDTGLERLRARVPGQQIRLALEPLEGEIVSVALPDGTRILIERA